MVLAESNTATGLPVVNSGAEPALEPFSRH
jgi:hypothetical protein